MSLPGSLARLAAMIAALVWIGDRAWASDDEATAVPGGLALALEADGAIEARGILPHDLSPEELTAALPGVDVSGIDRTGTAPAWEGQPALDALSIVLPRFRTASAQLGEKTLAMEGVLKSGLSAVGTEATLRAALGTEWHLDLRLAETAPVAEVVVTKAENGITVSGLLPVGIEPAQALDLLGPQAGDVGLAGGGEGGGPGWSAGLAALGETLDLFASATGRVSAGEVAIDGALLPGYPRDAVGDRLRARLREGWTARLKAEETPPSEGDRRTSLETGAPESFRRGYWLPDVSFRVSAERCRTEAEAALGREGIPFVEGAAQIEESGLPLLNRLAAIAARCLNSSSLRLEIGGHTDSVGNDAENDALSQARAETVRQALTDRGVRAEAVTAKGYGESRPVATNNTPEGRAQNRRIDFDWSDPEG